MRAWIDDRDAWIASLCRAMGCRERHIWTDEYGNGWCRFHGSCERQCQRERCGGNAFRQTAWCEEHAYRQELVDLAVTRGCPMLTLPDGRIIAPGLPTYGSVAKWYGDRDFCLVFGALLGQESLAV